MVFALQALAIALASLLHSSIERPFLMLKKRLHGKARLKHKPSPTVDKSELLGGCYQRLGQPRSALTAFHVA
jgi:hypothetical protein